MSDREKNIIETLREGNRELRDALAAANARAEAAEAAMREARGFHPRAMKLIDKRKNFVVVAEDEPYFLDVYMTIRANEQQKGRWTDEDEQQYHLALLNASWNLSQRGGEE